MATSGWQDTKLKQQTPYLRNEVGGYFFLRFD
jgi:hypothetical protein